MIITLTPKLSQDLDALGIRGRKGIRVIPLGLDLDRFYQSKPEGSYLHQQLGISGDSLFIGIVGRLVAIKRHEDLIKAVKILHNQGQRVHLVIIGGGEREDVLRQIVHQLGLAAYIHFLGFRRDLEKIYPHLDLVVLCSANEGMPVSLIEALVCGIPIVATEVGGVSDLLSDCPSCTFVPSFQIDRLAQALQKMIANKEIYREKAQTFRRVAFERYRLENLVNNLEQLYQELLGDL